MLQGDRRNIYSEVHQPYISLLPGYFDKVRAQEEFYVKAGFDAEGITDWLIGWWDAWEQRSVEMLRDYYFTDDMVYADPSGGSVDFYARQTDLIGFYYYLFKAWPDMAFWPIDDTPRSLPYFDFSREFLRIAVPWRLVARPRLTPRPLNGVGMDRYYMIRDEKMGWLISRIDTDGDGLFGFGEILPIPLRGPSQDTIRKFVKVLHRIVPGPKEPQLRPFVYDKDN